MAPVIPVRIVNTAVSAGSPPIFSAMPMAIAAVADFGWARFDGTIAWLLWGLVHVSFLIGFRNRLIVMLDWVWSYVTFQSGARLITGPGSH